MNTKKVLPILVWPNPLLHEQAEEVSIFDEQLSVLITDMIHTMESSNAYGLAAPQVGSLKRVFVTKIDNHNPRWFINPFIVSEPLSDNKKFVWREGCLSVPGYFEDRERPNQIDIGYQDQHGFHLRATLSGIEAFVFQHELDHLNGKVFVDDMSPLKTERVKTKIYNTLRRKAR